jgi:hypothetical protein
MIQYNPSKTQGVDRALVSHSSFISNPLKTMDCNVNQVHCNDRNGSPLGMYHMRIESGI